MKIKKIILVLFIGLTGLPFISKGNSDSDTTNIVSIDSLSSLIKNDLNFIKNQLDSNEVNISNNKYNDNTYVFHSSASVVYGSNSDQYLIWNTKMNNSNVKKQYYVNTETQEIEINNILQNIHIDSKKKVVVYMTNLLAYPSYKSYFYDPNQKTTSQNNNAGTNGQVVVPGGRYTVIKYGTDKVVDEVSKELYENPSAYDFTTIIVIRINEFYFKKTTTNGIKIIDFDSNKNYRDSLTIHHAIRIVRTRNISDKCIKEITSQFNKETTSNLKKFVTDISTLFKGEICDPTVDCKTKEDFQITLLNGTHLEILESINALIYPRDPNARTPGGVKIGYGDLGAAYDIYQKTLLNCVYSDARIQAIRTLINASWTSTPYEKIIIDLIQYTPSVDKKKLLDRLVSDKINNVSLLAALYRNVDLDEFDRLISVLHPIIKEVYPNSLSTEEAFSNKLFHSFGRGRTNSEIDFDQKINDDGKITLISKTSWVTGKIFEPGANFYANTPDLNPYSYVLIWFQTDYVLPNKTFVDNSQILLPACIAYGLFTYENKQRNLNEGKLILDVTAFAFTVGEVRALVRAGEYSYKLTLAIIDASMGAADIYINHGLINKLEQGDEGKKFLTYWSRFQLCYGFSTQSVPLIENALEMRKISRALEKGFIILPDQSKIPLSTEEIAALKKTSDDAVTIADIIKAKEGISISDDAIYLGANLKKAKQYLSQVKRTDGVVDLVIHGSGNKFTLIVNGEEKVMDGKALAGWLIDNKLDKSTIRILSCSNLESVEEMAKVLPDNTFIATNGIVRIHSDGGITSISKTDGSEDIWYTLKGETKTPRGPPAEPGVDIKNKSGSYIELGDSFTPRLSKYPNLESKYNALPTQDLKDKFKNDFHNASDDLLKQINDEGLIDSWEILSTDEIFRKNITDLQKLTTFIKNSGFSKSKLIESFKKTPDARKWIDLKIPENELNNTYNNFSNNPPSDFTPWTNEHKAQRWAQYKVRMADEGKTPESFETWSNKYDGNIEKANAATKATDDYYSSLNLPCPIPPCREVSINVNGKTRRLDIAYRDKGKAVEFKKYSEGKVYKSADIENEVLLDKTLLEQGTMTDIEWVFQGCEPSGPLRELLQKGPYVIKIKLIP